MCLYPRLQRNRKYQKNQKNGGIIPPVSDGRVLHVPIGCGNCMECRKQKAREWQVRLTEDIKTNTNGHFVTLTFSNESIKEINEKSIERKLLGYKDMIETVNIRDLKGYEKDNAIAKYAVRHFLENWRKKHKKSVRHWLVTELGHKGTENIHLHGIIWTDTPQDIKKIWKYGFIWDGYNKNGRRVNYVSAKTVNYIVKYINKIDKDHKTYKSKILTSAGIGGNYVNRVDSRRNKYKGKETEETYRTESGHKIALPIYLRNKIYTEEEREKLWINKLDEQVRWVNGIKIDISKGTEIYIKALTEAQRQNIQLGYGNDHTSWKLKQYEQQRRDMLNEKRIQNT